MKLADLQPKWIAVAGRNGQGLTFECPHCRAGTGIDAKLTRLCVLFANPLDGAEPHPHANEPGGFRKVCELLWSDREKTLGQDIVPPGYHWQRTGETFETLSLSPSVDCSASGHWHGFVQNGEIA